MPLPAPEATRTYYAAAVLGLRALDACEPRARRFGPEADARWERYRGALHDGDRLEVLLRDAAATWGVAFAYSRVFNLDGVATDEPFGPAWRTPQPRTAARHLATEATPTLDTVAQALGIQPAPVTLPTIHPATRLVIAGGAAILATAQAFQGRSDLDWARRVTVVADRPASRQLAGLASLFVQAVRPCTVLTSDEGTFPEGAVSICSPDAEPACAARLGR